MCVHSSINVVQSILCSQLGKRTGIAFDIEAHLIGRLVLYKPDAAALRRWTRPHPSCVPAWSPHMMGTADFFLPRAFGTPVTASARMLMAVATVAKSSATTVELRLETRVAKSSVTAVETGVETRVATSQQIHPQARIRTLPYMQQPFNLPIIRGGRLCLACGRLCCRR